MSALSSAKRMRGNCEDLLELATRGVPGTNDAISSLSGSLSAFDDQWRASCTYASERIAVDDAVRCTPIRSGGRWSLPIGMLTVKVLPRCNWLSTRTVPP